MTKMVRHESSSTSMRLTYTAWCLCQAANAMRTSPQPAYMREQQATAASRHASRVQMHNVHLCAFSAVSSSLQLSCVRLGTQWSWRCWQLHFVPSLHTAQQQLAGPSHQLLDPPQAASASSRQPRATATNFRPKAKATTNRHSLPQHH